MKQPKWLVNLAAINRKAWWNQPEFKKLMRLQSQAVKRKELPCR